MSKLWSSMLILAVALFVVVGPAGAADEKKDGKKRERPSAEQIFKKLDADSDGKITADELAKSRRFDGDTDKAAAAIKRMDTDKNGSVSLEEFTAAIKKHHGDRKRGSGKKAPEKK